MKRRLELWSRLIDAYVERDHLVVDVGCGPGVLTLAAARKAGKVIAFDGSPEMLHIARDRVGDELVHNVDFRELRLEQLEELRGVGADVLLCSSVLEYVEDPARVLVQLRTLAAPECKAIFSFPNGDSPFRKLETLSYRVTRRPLYRAHSRNVRGQAELVRMLNSCGWNVVATTYDSPQPAFTGRAFSFLGFAMVVFVCELAKVGDGSGRLHPRY